MTPQSRPPRSPVDVGRERTTTARLALVLAALAAGCSSSTGISEDEIACPPGSTLTYASFGKAFLEANCLSCHGGRQSPNLSTQAAVKASAGKILDKAVFHDDMPDGGSLTREQRVELGRWLRCGAP